MGCTTKTLLVHGAMLSAMLLFSGSHVMSRLAFDYLHPVWFSALQRAFGVWALFALAWVVEGPQLAQQHEAEEEEARNGVPAAGSSSGGSGGASNWASAASFAGYSPLKSTRRSCRAMLPPRRIWSRLIVGGMFAYWAQTMFFTFGIKESSASQAGICQPLTAVFTTTFAIALKMERFSWWKVAGILLAVVGVLTMVMGPMLTSDVEDDTNAYGAMMFVGNTFTFSVGLILTKQILSIWPPIITTAWGYVVCLVFFSVSVIPFDNPAPLFDWGVKGWAAVLYTAYFAGFLGYVLFNSAAKHIWPSVASIYITVQPASSSFFGWLFLNETLGVFDAAGAVLIFIGVVLVVSVKIRDAARDEQVNLLGHHSTDSSGSGSGAVKVVGFGTSFANPTPYGYGGADDDFGSGSTPLGGRSSDIAFDALRTHSPRTPTAAQAARAALPASRW